MQRNIQYQLFEASALAKLKKGGGTQLWVQLLYHVEAGSIGAKEIRTEMSLPSEFQLKRIAKWSERIILRPMSVSGSSRSPASAKTSSTNWPTSWPRVCLWTRARRSARLA